MKSGWLRAVGGLSVVVMASALGACLPPGGSGGGGGGSACEADEVRARPNGLPRDCYFVCETQSDCDGATTCSEVNGGNDMACLPEPGTTNNDNNDNNTNNTTSSNNSNNTTGGNNSNNSNNSNNTTGCSSDADCAGATPVCDAGECVPAPDPCAGVRCEAGFTCEAGQCVEDEPPGCTQDSQCDAGDVCVDGECVIDPDPCASVRCEAGFTCEAGQCVEDEPPGCTQDAQCQGDDVCVDGECVPENTNNCIFNSDCSNIEICQDSMCVRDPNIECVVDGECSGANEVCQNNACVVPVDPVDQACSAFCENIYGSCPTGTCMGLDASNTTFLSDALDQCLNGGTAQDGSVINPCRQDYVADPTFAAQVDQFGAEVCGQSESLERVFCQNFGFGAQCGCPELSVGEPCTADTDCEGGTLTAICVGEFDANTGDPTGYVGGYCVAGPCDAGSQDAGAIAVGATTGCGEDGVCMNEQGQSGVTSICYSGCEDNNGCRNGYSCEILGFFSDGTPAGRCLPACTTNADCPVYTDNTTGDEIDSFCNAESWCEAPCDPSDANSCGSSGNLTCTTRMNFNPTLVYTGSCEVTP